MKSEKEIKEELKKLEKGHERLLKQGFKEAVLSNEIWEAALRWVLEE